MNGTDVTGYPSPTQAQTSTKGRHSEEPGTVPALVSPNIVSVRRCLRSRSSCRQEALASCFFLPLLYAGLYLETAIRSDGI
ncbi:hypothetical protein RRG08_049469 [Elysia crispata]|uniref:Uncharacterized protein n=1 Tax=Elysia crispata TaxID=231223 RepID=A0AAE0ZS05_9GAST|nr:hypothetical protein RRG08_049469 [Elysia crispata]